MIRRPTKERKPTLNNPDKGPVMKKRKRLSPVSDRHAKRLAAYREEKKRRGNGPFPCVMCGKPTVIGKDGSFHHPSARRTMRTILYFVPIHEIPCHQWIKANESEALRLGYLTAEFFRSIK